MVYRLVPSGFSTGMVYPYKSSGWCNAEKIRGLS